MAASRSQIAMLLRLVLSWFSIGLLYAFVIASIKIISKDGYPTHFGSWLLIAAFATGIIYFFILVSIRKMKAQKALTFCLQGFMVFSALPYILSPFLRNNYGSRLWFPQFYMGTFGIVVFYIAAVLPEITGFLGLVLLRMRKITLGVVLLCFCIVLAIDILPVRMSFIFDQMKDVGERIPIYEREEPGVLSYGKDDKVFEMKRSLETIEDITLDTKMFSKKNLRSMIDWILDFNSYSHMSQNDSLAAIVLWMPDLKKFPNMLQPSYYKSIPDSERYVIKGLIIDIGRDSDEDGLSDYEEAMLLSDIRDKDTDDDGIKDMEDSDPLNPLIRSSIAEIRAAFFDFASRTLYGMEVKDTLCFFVCNFFVSVKGEIGNFSGKVVLLNSDQWEIWRGVFRMGLYNLDSQKRVRFSDFFVLGRCLIDPLNSMAVLDFHGDGVTGYVLFVKMFGKWKFIAWKGIAHT